MKLFHSTFPATLATVVSLGLSAACSLADDATISHTDKSFVTGAYENGLAEIKMGKMGETKTTNPDVKAFATEMVNDHTTANTELKTIADSKKVEVASDVTTMAKAKALMLDAKSGGDFDKAYVEDMVSDHKKAVDAFEKAANESTDPDVKAFAAKTLPTLKSHLSMAEALQPKVGK